MIYGNKASEYSIRSKKYTEYLNTHIENVKKAFNDNIDIFMTHFSKNDVDLARENIKSHDKSKFSLEEFDGYLDKFYPSKYYRISDETAININYDMAWLHHYTHNLHHPEYWVFIDSNPKTEPSLRLMEMSPEYLIEMICDWESFSYTGKGTAYEFYHKVDRKEGLLHPSTRRKLEEVLEDMYNNKNH